MNEIGRILDNDLEMSNKQMNFLETKIGQIVNKSLDFGLKYILPDMIENEVIDIKDTFIKEGFFEGIKKAIDSAVELGKSAIGIATGNFENIKQVQNAIKKGGIIDSIGSVVDKVVIKGVESGKISQNLGRTIEKSKDTLLSTISKSIENEFQKQLQSVEKLEKYSNNWKEYYNQRNFDGMQREYEKIQEKLKDIFPIENAIKTARILSNMHNLIKNKGKNFDLTEEEMELAKLI